MLSIHNIIMVVIAVVLAVTLVPTIWSSVWTDALVTGGVNGTTATILKLVPLIFVGTVVIGACLMVVGV